MTTQDYFRPETDFEQREVTSYKTPGSTERLLYTDSDSGSYVRLLDMPPGAISGDEPLHHADFDEIVYVLEGVWHNVTTGEDFGPGTVAVFPRGVDHGPFTYPEGARFIEVRQMKQG